MRARVVRARARRERTEAAAHAERGVADPRVLERVVAVRPRDVASPCRRWSPLFTAIRLRGRKRGPLASMARMRIALVSPYSWTYPGGVTRHIEALAEQFLAHGPRRPRARALRPRRPPAPRACTAARGPQPRDVPDYLSRSARTSACRSNGAVSNLAPDADAVATLRRELAPGGFDVVHVHEPVAPIIGWDALHQRRRRSSAPSTATRRTAISQRIANADGRARAGSTASTCASPSPRPRPGPAGASSAAATASSPTASTLPRRRPPARCRAPARAAADRLRRPGGRAQGPARAAARLRGAARARARRARDRRRRRRRRSRRCCSTRRGVDGPRQRPTTSASTPRSTRADVLVRAVARRRELRHGADRGVRGRHAGRRLRHRRLPRRRRATASTACSSRAATPPRSPRRCATSRSSPSAARELGAPPRAARRALRLAARRRRGGRGLRGRAAPMPAARGDAARASPLAHRARARRRPAAVRPERLPRLEPDAAPAAPARRARAARRRRDRASPCSASASPAWRSSASGSTGSASRSLHSSPAWVLAGLGLMCVSMVLRAVSWHAILRAAHARRAACACATRCRARSSAC